MDRHTRSTLCTVRQRSTVHKDYFPLENNLHVNLKSAIWIQRYCVLGFSPPERAADEVKADERASEEDAVALDQYLSNQTVVLPTLMKPLRFNGGRKFQTPSPFPHLSTRDLALLIRFEVMHLCDGHRRITLTMIPIDSQAESLLKSVTWHSILFATTFLPLTP